MMTWATLDEPVFSDGLLPDAVNTVVNSKSLPGKTAVYTSSADNDGNNGYRDNYHQLSDKQVRNGSHGNLHLDQVPEEQGGWHNWNPNGGFEPVTTVTAPGPSSFQYDIFLQWDDLFDQDHGITTDYNFLVFDENGNYLPDLSGTTNAFATQQPFQGIGNLDLGVVYQIAITKSRQTDPKAGSIPKTHQFALYTTLDGLSTLIGKYFHPYRRLFRTFTVIRRQIQRLLLLPTPLTGNRPRPTCRNSRTIAHPDR